MNFTFNNIRKDYLKIMVDESRPTFAPITNEILTVPNRPGGYIQVKSTGVRFLTIPVLITLDGTMTMQKMKEDLAAWLITDDPCELIFDDEEDRTYYAVLNGEIALDETNQYAKGEISFICVDPYKYGHFRQTTPTLDDNGTFIVENEGNADALPVFEITVKESLSHFDLITGDSYMRVGEPLGVDDVVYNEIENAFYSNMGTIVGWSQVTEIDNGNIAGSIVSDGTGFYPTAFGTVIDATAWQGPALKTSLSKEVQDFRLDARVELTSGVGKTGMIEIYLLDAGNNIVGKVGIEDRISNTADPLVKAKAGDVSTGTWFCSRRADSPTTWRNFDGLLRIQRVDNKWTAYFAQISSDGTHHARLGADNSVYYLDVDEKYMSKIAQVQVAFRKFPNTQNAHMKVKDITINQINTEDDGIPYILNEGDVLTLDHENCNISINGESRLDLKDFGADFFKLKPGLNEITMQPIVEDWSVSWKDRFK